MPVEDTNNKIENYLNNLKSKSTTELPLLKH